jgi:hypothetical protein
MPEQPEIDATQVVAWTMPRKDARDLLGWLRHNRPLGMPDRTFTGLLDAIEQDPTDAQVPMTDPERDRWRRIVEAQRKDICDLVRQLEDASRRADFWEVMAEPLEPVTRPVPSADTEASR